MRTGTAAKKDKDKDQKEPVAATPKKRGRAKGTVREIFVVCAGLYESANEAQLGSEKFHISLGKDATDADILGQASKMFRDKFGVAPSSTFGPFYERKGKTSSYVKKRDSIKMDLADLQFSGKSATAQYNGWNVMVNYIKNNDEAAFIMYKDEIAPGDKPKAKPNGKTVFIRSLQNLKPLTV